MRLQRYINILVAYICVCSIYLCKDSAFREIPIVFWGKSPKHRQYLGYLCSVKGLSQ